MAAIPSIGEFILGAPYTIHCDESLAVADQLMHRHSIRHLPVLDGRRIFGIISDRDLKLAKAVNGDRRNARPVYVKDICINQPYVVDRSEPLDAVVATMAKRRLGCAIVTSDGEVGGIFTTTDACRLLAELARKITW